MKLGCAIEYAGRTVDMPIEKIKWLESLGYDVEWHGYPMAHAVCAQEIEDIAQFLRKVYGH